MMWLYAGAGLVALVFIHELGHFSVALAVRMRPRSFYVGFPPALVKIRHRGIEFGIGMIPLGGLVRIPGMHRPSPRDFRVFMDPAVEEQPSLAPATLAVRRALTADDYDAARRLYPELEEELASVTLSPSALRAARRALREVEEGTSSDAYWRAPIWKRVAVIAAGPLANVVAAFLILFIVFATSGAPTNNGPTVVAKVESGKPAAHAGLQHGDRIVAVNGVRATTFAQVTRRIRASHGGSVTVTVIRRGHLVTLGPESTVRFQGRWIWGFESAPTFVSVPLGSAASQSLSDLGRAVTGTLGGLGSLFTGHTRDLSSPVKVTEVSHSALQAGATYYFELLALLSMSLALLNLLPLLPFDGGHILFSLVEGVRRRALAREVYERVSVVGIALLVLVYVIAFSNDIPGPH